MGTIWQDLRYAVRVLGRAPVVTTVVVISLALGIGANTAIFTLINAVMVKSLPVEKPEQLVLLGDGNSSGVITGLSGRWDIFSYPLYEHLRRHAQSFEGLCAFRTEMDRLGVRREGDVEMHLAWGRLVSGNYFSVLGVRALLGRTLTQEDDRTGATPATVISYRYWERQLHLDRSIVGRAVTANGTQFTVVGVTPPEFFGESLELADFWLPMTLQPRVMQRESFLEEAGLNWINVIGRLKPGINLRQGQADVNVLFHQFLTEQSGPHPSAEDQRVNQSSYISLSSGAGGISYLRFRYSEPLRVLLAVVGLVLLIACANVANLLLSQSSAREKEISMRQALGASRARLVRQLLTESVLLAGMGGAVGLLFASWGVDILVLMVSGGGGQVPLSVSPDARVLGFTLAVSVLTGLLFGLAPALRATRSDIALTLKGGTPGSGGTRRWGLARTLVIAQVALSLLLLIGAGLFVRSLQKLRQQDLGFNPQHVLEVGIDPRIAGYKPEQLNGLYQALLDRVNALPGVMVSSLSLYSPMTSNWSGGVSIEGYAAPPGQEAWSQWNRVGPRYCETAGMTVRLGRDIGPQDTAAAPKVAVINETFARRYFPNQNPIGKRFSANVPAKVYEIEVVGVVKDFKFNNPRQQLRPVYLVPLAQSGGDDASRYAADLEVRAVGDPTSVAGLVREAIREVDKGLPVSAIRTLREQVDGTLTRERLVALLSGFFGLLGLVLACVGLYGVMSFTVSRRTPEIGIRMALGAQRGIILKMILGESLLLVLIGIVIGLGSALAAGRLVASMLFGLGAYDPVSVTAAIATLAVVALVAGYLPARRASRTKPMTALRHE